MGKYAVWGNSKRGCNSRCFFFFLTQLHLACLFLDTGWELCGLGQVTSLRPFFGRGTTSLYAGPFGGLKEAVQAEFTVPGGPHQAPAVPSSSSRFFSCLRCPLRLWIEAYWPLSCLPPSGLITATPSPPPRPCHPVLPVGTCEPGGGGYQWWRAELDHQEEGGTAVLAQAALFIIPHHLELGLNPPQQLGLV